MAEYINREELLKDIEDSVRFSTRNGVSAELRGAHKIVDRIRCASACDVVEVVHGEWIMRGGVPRCSECGEKALQKDEGGTGGFSHEYVRVKSKHCPNCGAKMDRERRSEE